MNIVIKPSSKREKRMIISSRVIFVLLIILCFLPITSCLNGTNSFDENSELSNVYGRLTVETFYGPPGYGEDPIHDSKLITAFHFSVSTIIISHNKKLVYSKKISPICTIIYW